MKKDEHFRILMMGFIDEELTDEDRHSFIEECYRDPDLAAELAKYRRLQDVTNSLRLREPGDYEYERFFAKLSSRIERRVAWTLLRVGLAATLVTSLYALFTSDLSTAFKVSAGVSLSGFGMLVMSVVRVRQRIMRLDRYQGVMR